MKRILFAIVVLAGFGGCNREPELIDLVQDMLVQTEYDQTLVDGNINVFNTYSTFTMLEDTIGFVSNIDSDTILVDGDNVNITGGYVTPVADLVRDYIEDAGFTWVEDDESPDFAVNIAVLDNFNFYQTVSYPGYYSGYYGYYGYYYPVVQSHYSSYGTLIIQIVNTRNVTNNQYQVIWTAFIGDLYSTIDLRTKTLEAIDQAFAQSPYILKD